MPITVYANIPLLVALITHNSIRQSLKMASLLRSLLVCSIGWFRVAHCIPVLIIKQDSKLLRYFNRCFISYKCLELPAEKEIWWASSVRGVPDVINLWRSLSCENSPKLMKFAWSYKCRFGMTYTSENPVK